MKQDRKQWATQE